MVKQKLLIGAQVLVLALVASFLVGGRAAADQVIPDDLIVQGSLCVGLDCVNNENFGFDTIRLKENNLRIKFEDTSVGTFPTNDWQILVNDSANGGASKFSVEDVTGARTPFTIEAGATTNSIFVDSTGRVGFRTSTPVLDLHVSTSNTPALRLEQNNSGGFTAQTWDVAGNEANFFVRDVTSGSRLPFRIRPGAPTSSIDVNAVGSVGIGTASPNGDSNDRIIDVLAKGTILGRAGGGLTALTQNDANLRLYTVSANNWAGVGADANGHMWFRTSVAGTPDARMVIFSSGDVGIGTTTATAQLHTTGSVRFAGLPNCSSGIASSANGTLSCMVSSAQFKQIAGALEPRKALTNVMALRPQTGSYRDTPDVPEHWLIAEEVAAVDPALVGLNEGKPFTVKTQNVVADLIVVVQQQQHRIDELERRLATRN